jgi:hypothetical protein
VGTRTASASRYDRRRMTATVPDAAPTRVVYRIDDENQQVTVVGVFGRAEAHRPR